MSNKSFADFNDFGTSVVQQPEWTQHLRQLNEKLNQLWGICRITGFGVATMSGGAVVVPAKLFTRTCSVFLTPQSANPLASVQIDGNNKLYGVSFKVLSSDGTDARSVSWMIVEPN